MGEKYISILAYGERTYTKHVHGKTLFVDVVGDVDNSDEIFKTAINKLEKIMPVAKLYYLRMEPLTPLEFVIEKLDITEGNPREFIIEIDDSKVIYNLRAEGYKHRYEVIMEINESNEVRIAVQKDNRVIYEEREVKHTSRFENISTLMLIILSKFAKTVITSERIVRTYKLLREIPSQCIHSGVLKLNICADMS